MFECNLNVNKETSLVVIIFTEYQLAVVDLILEHFLILVSSMWWLLKAVSKENLHDPEASDISLKRQNRREIQTGSFQLSYAAKDPCIRKIVCKTVLIAVLPAD